TSASEYNLVGVSSVNAIVLTGFTPFDEWDFKVRALRGDTSGYGEFSNVFGGVVTLPPELPVPTPSAPQISILGRGMMSVHWNGLTNAGDGMPRHVRYVYLLMTLTGLDDWVRHGTVLESGASLSLPGEVGARYDMTF